MGMIFIDDNDPTSVGHSNDNEATVLVFPIANVISEYGEGGDWTILIRRPNEADVYPVPYSNYTTDDKALYWTITATDVQYPGDGMVQLQYKIGEVVKMSRKYVLRIAASLVETEDTPTYLETWLELFQEKLDEDLSDYYTKEEVDELIDEAGTLKPGYAPDTTRTAESTAGAKGWYIKAYDDSILPNEAVELCNADGTPADKTLFNLNDILSCKAGFSANYCWKIEDITEYDEGWYLIVSRTDNFTMLAQGAPFDPASHLYASEQPGYIWNPEKPGIGTVEIGVGAMAIGTDNKANEWGALAIGDGNEVDGRYAFANGQNNKVAYGSTALGHNNNVYGYDAFASGSYITLRNWRTSGFGQANSMNAVNGFVSGHGNNATKDAHDGISIRGTYAVNQQTDTFIDVVGGGTDNEHRANASALTPAGNYRIKGDIFIKCNPDSSGGTNIRTALDGKEDKGTFQLIGIYNMPTDTVGDWELTIPAQRCALLFISFPRLTAESFRVFANEAQNQNGGQIAVTAGSTGVTNAKMKFDCTHGILEGEWAKQDGLGGYVAKTTYASYENEPVVMNAVTKVIIRNITNNVVRGGTKIKIYGYV